MIGEAASPVPATEPPAAFSTARVSGGSSAYFVYPFLFDPRTFEERVAAVTHAQRDTKGLYWKPHHVVQDDLLQHVARFLNPDQADTSAAQRATAFWWEEQLPAPESGWVSWVPDKRTPEADQSEANRAIPFQRGAAHLLLFCVGVGLLALRADVTNQDVADWLAFAHYFRYAGKNRITRPDGVETPALVVINGLIRTANLEREVGKNPWWSEVFAPGKTLPYVVVFVDNCTPEEQSELRYRLRNFIRLDQVIAPCAEDRAEAHPAELSYADGQCFFFSIEGGGFLGCNAPSTSFFRRTLVNWLGDSYFLLFLLALHQRFALMRLSQQVAERWMPGNSRGGRLRAFAEIRDLLLEFTARGYFVQVMQRQNHHQCYRRWQETFQLPALYQEVSNEVREMQDFLVLKRQERVESLVALLTCFSVALGTLAVVFGFFGINIAHFTNTEGLTWRQIGWIVGIAAFTVISATAAALRLLRRPII